MGQRQGALVDRRRLALLERDVQAGGDQVVGNGVEPLRALGVAIAHVMGAAGGVGVVGGGHPSWRCEVSGTAAFG
ncbi:hypothetical protein [Methylibium sp. T29-B]|uniref:hypothetical protein n=1 Tax=Methylibium sp. T29-B TaxID=1437443 RepID=UPI001E323B54|nr:hypothetical protein [Methylibium sp. T29-B]